MLFLLSFFLFFFAQKRNLKSYQKSSVFYLSLFSGSNRLTLNENAKKIKELGGAGFEYVSQNKTYVIAFAYTDKKDALSVSQNLQEQYKAEVIEVYFDKISLKAKNKLFSNASLKECFDFLYEKVEESYNLYVDFSKDKITNASLYKIVVQSSMQAKNCLASLSQIVNENALKDIKSELLIALNCYEKFCEELLSSLYQGQSINQNLALFVVNVCENERLVRKKINNL